jgi:hypothetical protein
MSLIVAACVFGSAAISITRNRWLPKEHLSKETQDVIRLATGMISVLASLVLGLLVATTKSAFDQTDTEVKGAAADLIMLERTLRDYGPGSLDARALLQRFTARTLDQVWPGETETAKPRVDDLAAGVLLQQLRRTIRALTPSTGSQTELRGEAVQLANGIARTRWLLIEQSGSSVRPLFLIVLVTWIVLIFASFGFNAPRNATVLTAFLVCALAIGGAIFLILEMDGPFDGYITVSSKPMHKALKYMQGQ